MAAGQERRRRSTNRYSKLLERIFHAKYGVEKTRIEFVRDEITEAAAALDLPLPKNLGDVIYTFRYRAPLPESIPRHRAKWPHMDHRAGRHWALSVRPCPVPAP